MIQLQKFHFYRRTSPLREKNFIQILELNKEIVKIKDLYTEKLHKVKKEDLKKFEDFRIDEEILNLLGFTEVKVYQYEWEKFQVYAWEEEIFSIMVFLVVKFEDGIAISDSYQAYQADLGKYTESIFKEIKSVPKGMKNLYQLFNRLDQLGMKKNRQEFISNYIKT